MSLKHINAGFFITVVLFSVVHNLKHGKQQLVQEPILSEIKRNITLVNHLLQDLLQKYAQLKQLAREKNEQQFFRGDSKQLAREKNARDFFRGDSKIRLKAKVRLAEPRKPMEPRWFQTDNNFVRKSKFGLTRIQKPRAEDTYEADNPSPDSRELSPINDMTHIRDSLEKNAKIKESVKDYSSENMKDSQKEVSEPHEVEKLLVIHLEDPTEANVKKKRVSNSTQEFISKTNQKFEITKSFGPNFLPLEPITKSILSEPETTESHDSDVQEEKEMRREMMKVKQLRTAVGIACSQVVVRKCQKAIKSVLKDVCKSDRKCSHDFNNDFKSNGMAACNKVYDLVSNQTIKNRGRYVDFEPNAGELQPGPFQQPNEKLTGAQFIDYTREGELVDMTCMQALSKVKEPNVDRTSVKNAKTQDVNILRDRYEKACRKESNKKCRTACNTAAHQTCNKHECIVEKKKALKLSCKRWCKENILYGENSNSDSSSSQSNSRSQSKSQSKSQSQSVSSESR